MIKISGVHSDSGKKVSVYKESIGEAIGVGKLMKERGYIKISMITVTDSDFKAETYRCPGCGGTFPKPDNYSPGYGCDDCTRHNTNLPGYYDDSWGDHNPNYDY